MSDYVQVIDGQIRRAGPRVTPDRVHKDVWDYWPIVDGARNGAAKCHCRDCGKVWMEGGMDGNYPQDCGG
jgi:hypothetical protein